MGDGIYLKDCGDTFFRVKIFQQVLGSAFSKSGLLKGTGINPGVVGNLYGAAYVFGVNDAAMVKDIVSGSSVSSNKGFSVYVKHPSYGTSAPISNFSFPGSTFAKPFKINP